MGERALGMAGAFTGLASDPSAVYYNPAGLARLEETALSASLSLAAFDRVVVEGGHRTDAGTDDLTYKGRPSLPLFAALVRQIGKKDESGVRHHAIALATFSIEERSLSIDTSRYREADDGRAWLSTLYARHDRSTRWYGGSYAYRHDARLTFGCSLFLSHGKASALDERFDLSLGPPDASGAGTDPASRLESVRLSQDTKALVARVGFLYLGSKLRVGLMLQPPSVHLRGNAKLRDRLVHTDTEGTYREPSSRHLPARVPFPAELRLGLAYQLRSSFILDADLSVHEPGVAVRAPWAANVTGRFISSSQTIVIESQRFERVPTANAALGTELGVHEKVRIHTGVFTDMSAARRLPATSNVARPDHIHRFGAALSVTFGTKDYQLSVGSVARVGVGSALTPSGDELAPPYQRVDAREHTIFVFLTGARSVVAKLADVAIDKLNERQEQKAAEEPAEGTRKER